MVNPDARLSVADRPLTFNVGLRYERTDTVTGGYGRVPQSLTVSPQDHTALVVNYTPAQFLTTSNKYNYFLPSLDLNFFPLSDLKVRFDASRTLTRPPLNEITPTLSVTGSRVGALRGMTPSRSTPRDGAASAARDVRENARTATAETATKRMSR